MADMSDSAPLQWRHTVIDDDPAGSANDILLIGDIDGDGNDDIVVGGKFAPGPGEKPAEANLVWYQWPDWQRHVIGCGELEAGGVLMDVTGNGRLDVIAGNQWNGKQLYWWENPDDPTQRWQRRLITDDFQKYHDQAVGDLDGDGVDELLVLSQVAKVIVYYDIPDDPRTEPWPVANRHVIREDIEVEGACIADLYGDGTRHIVAGPNLFSPGADPTKPWSHRVLLEDFELSRVALADVNGDGNLDIILAEGESRPGRLVWLEGPDFKRVHPLRGDLFHPHSLDVADFTGNGAPDIFVGEMNLGENPNPRLILLLNDGHGRFTEQIIECPQGTHEAKVGYLGGSDRPCIIGKPYAPHNQVDLWEMV